MFDLLVLLQVQVCISDRIGWLERVPSRQRVSRLIQRFCTVRVKVRVSSFEMMR